MNSPHYPIATPIKYTRTAVFFTCSIMNLILNESASIAVSLYTDKFEMVDVKRYDLIGEDYKRWNSDDYIVEYVQNRLSEEVA